MALVMTDRRGEAIASLEEALTLPGVPTLQILAVLARAHASAGRMADARRTIARLAAESNNFAISPGYAAVAFAGVGDRRRAIGLLEGAHDQHSGNIVNIAVEPLYDPLRSEPRFQALVDKMGLSR
jgi:hypothetical protein